MSLTVKKFGTLKDGTSVDLYTLKNESGMTMEVTPYGCRIVSLWVPDKNGVLGDVVLGHDTLEEYEQEKDFLGAAIGRFANRIGNSRFTLNGKTYTLSPNEDPNTLHGGPTGYYARVWRTKCSDCSDEAPSITFAYTSPDGEEGYPGTVELTIRYTLSTDNALIIDYTASSDAETPVNLTNHSYFNLSGDHSSTILNHELTIDADGYTVCDSGLIPTGEIASVEGNACDFRKGKTIGQDIKAPMLKATSGYDHNYVLNGSGMRKIAEAYEAISGRKMLVFTDLPGVQLYTGNNMSGVSHGKKGVQHPNYSAFCLETQFFPDTPNKPQFPSCILEPGKTFTTTTIYKFETVK